MITLSGTKIILDDQTTNFDLRELVPKDIFDAWGLQSIRFLQTDGIRWLQFCRDWFGAPHIVNNWHTGGRFHLRGVRPYQAGMFTMLTDIHGTDVKDELRDLLSSFGIDTHAYSTGSWSSVHKNGGAFDFNVSGLTPAQVRTEILNNQTEFMNAGLTVLESGKFAPTWVHGDNRPTGAHHIVIISPGKSRA